MTVKHHLIGALRGHRSTTLALVDAAIWFVALYAACALRLEDLAVSIEWTTASSTIPLLGVLVMSAVAATVHVVAASFLRLHGGRSTIGSAEELFLLASVTGLTGLVTTAVNLVSTHVSVPRSSPIIASFLALCLAAWARGLWRLVRLGAGGARQSSAPRVLVVGAGEGGRQLISSMLNDPAGRWNPVAILDDDPRKKHFRHRGLAVRGTLADLSTVADDLSATTVVLAIPSASRALIAQVTSDALAQGLEIKLLPGVDQLLDGVSVRSVRDVEPSDLLGRQPVETDLQAIAAYLRGKRVLVTGAGGSIGSEICRQLSRFSPALVAYLDRDESALHTLALSIDGRADLESEQIVLADIRDAQRIDAVFDAVRPDIVFHSAALKHVNVLENHASEALQTNVWGTLNLLDASERHGVERFVNISTDKAADPVNVLGYSKRIAERLTSERSRRVSGTYLSVRFGNVFGTNGSVIKTFASQIEAGGPITVTDADVTRYFMTVHEAVQLVIQAAAIGSPGDALVLDMGEPVRILDVARRMIDMSQQDVRVVFTGLKPGEKLHEQLHGADEHGLPSAHPLISRVAVPPVDPTHCLLVDRSLPNAEIVADLRELAGRSAHISTGS